MRHRGIIFDMDGTLLNTLADIAAAVNRYLSANGFPVHPQDAYRHFVGDGSEALIRRALPESARLQKHIDAGLAAFMEDYGRNWHRHTRLYKGIAEMLDQLTGMGVKMAILSNKPHVFVKECVRFYLPKWRFEAALGYQRGLPRKPDPTGALMIVRQTGIQALQFMFVGDSGVDMQTAAAAGMFAVGAAWGFRTEAELKANGSRFIARNPADVIRLVNASA